MRFLKLWKVRILLIFAIIGPGFITANVDNDAGGIYTYALAGAKYGYALLWTIIPMAFALAFAQEISARMGVVTGKGLSELIRESRKPHRALKRSSPGGLRQSTSNDVSDIKE